MDPTNNAAAGAGGASYYPAGVGTEYAVPKFPFKNVADVARAELEYPPGLGPVYGVPLIDTLPLGRGGGMLQQMPSNNDLNEIRKFANGDRVAAGFEVLLWHWRRQCSISTVLADDLAKFTGRTVHDELRTAGKIVDDNPGL